MTGVDPQRIRQLECELGIAGGAYLAHNLRIDTNAKTVTIDGFEIPWLLAAIGPTIEVVEPAPAHMAIVNLPILIDTRPTEER